MVEWIKKMLQNCQSKGSGVEENERENMRMLKIESMLALTAVILVFLGFAGSFRRRCSNGAFAMVAFAAYTLTPVVIAYTLGLIQSAPFCSWRLPIWATYLVVVLGNVNSYTAHRLEDIQRWRSFQVDSAARYFMISLLIASYAFQNGLILILFVVLFMKVDERAQALMQASNSVMQKNHRLISDYMSTEHDSNHGDPATMRGYRYLVSVPEEATTAKCRRKAAPWLDGVAPQYRQLLEETDEVITVEKVWNCESWLLSVSRGDRDGRIKDLCLSFSLFKFICLKFTGYSLPQQAHQKLGRLIKHLLSQPDGPKRVFRVIEVELAFLFDLFYTKYPMNLHRHRKVYRFLLLPIGVVVTFIFFLVIWIFSEGVFPVAVTFLLLMSILVVKLTQFTIMIFSEWAKVIYICKYVRKGWWRRSICVGQLIRIMCRVQLVKPWGRQLRQYSFLKSYSYTPCKCIYNRFTAAWLDQKRNGQKQSAPTNLSEQVKNAIARSLQQEDTDYLEKGRAYLRLNSSFDELSWACNLETTTHIILVWHIATAFCKHKKPPGGAKLSQGQRDNFGVATQLSQYLAYLVVFAPSLLPDHPCRTEYIFDCAVTEAKKLFRDSSASMEKRIQALEGVGSNEQSIVGRGARLGMQLVSRVANEEQIWQVLADFWTDMILYVAPSNDTAAHAQYLTTGGEFVTHIWVLVSHAGITRDPRGRGQQDDPERN